MIGPDGGWFAWRRTEPPGQEPITLTEAKLQIRVNHTLDDALINSEIQAAREEAERVLGRGLLTQTWECALDRWFDEIPLPYAAPLQSITSVRYYAEDGALTTLPPTVYEVDVTSLPGRLWLAAGQAWPTLHGDRLAARVVITYVVGWTSPDLVPERIKTGVRMYVGYLYQNRDGFEPLASDARDAAVACWSDRIRVIAPTRPQWMDRFRYGHWTA